jgi:hypothetical protein
MQPMPVALTKTRLSSREDQHKLENPFTLIKIRTWVTGREYRIISLSEGSLDGVGPPFEQEDTTGIIAKAKLFSRNKDMLSVLVHQLGTDSQVFLHVVDPFVLEWLQVRHPRLTNHFQAMQKAQARVAASRLGSGQNGWRALVFDTLWRHVCHRCGIYSVACHDVCSNCDGMVFCGKECHVSDAKKHKATCRLRMSCVRKLTKKAFLRSALQEFVRANDLVVPVGHCLHTLFL